MPFLPSTIEHPRWKLHGVASSHSYNSDDRLYGGWFTIDPGGEVTWTRLDRVYRLVLTPGERERVRALDPSTCLPTNTERAQAFVDRFHAGLHELDSELELLADSMVQHYYTDRLAALGPIAIDLAVSATSRRSIKYNVRVANLHVTVSRNGRVVLAEAIEPSELVGLVDWWLAGDHHVDSSSVTGRGVLSVRGVRRVVKITPFVEGQELRWYSFFATDIVDRIDGERT